ncbi:MAG: hypothetical protein IKE42_07270 [Aquamicrobium sp.]|uniref:hypothetical protein n=1 Tax=Mesorhizobium sp. Pch-S TaxID=2082387 RepID=UPI001012632D|nr:hypothetical protein [Mesorhizobium sp. Pch-S]MBR2687637.1 hypothetical protein [Aquamicrobium sp.]
MKRIMGIFQDRDIFMSQPDFSEEAAQLNQVRAGPYRLAGMSAKRVIAATPVHQGLQDGFPSPN